MRKQRQWIIVSLLLVLGLMLAACGQPSAAPSGEAPSGQAATGGEAGGEAVTLRVWTHQNESFNAGLQALADAYMAEHPDVDIQFETFDYDTYIQTLQTALPAGTEADVLQMFGTWTCSYVEGQNLDPVPEGVISMADAQEKFFAAPLAGYTCDDTLYGLPQEFNIEYGAALVNTAIAEEVGIEDIAAGWESWDDFIADGAKMSKFEDGVMTRAGYNFTSGDALGFSFYSLIVQQGGSYLDTEAQQFTINTPEGKKALELMKRFVDEKLVDPLLFNDESNWVGDSFFQQTSAMGLVGPWVIAEYAGDFPEVRAAAKYVPLPYWGDAPKFVADSGWGLTVSANSQVKDAAWDFVKFVTLNDENALQWNIASGTIPAIAANTQGDPGQKLITEFPHFEPFLPLLQYGQYVGHMPDRDLLWYDITYQHILNMLQGNESIDDALSAIEREANEMW